MCPVPTTPTVCIRISRPISGAQRKSLLAILAVYSGSRLNNLPISQIVCSAMALGE